MSETKLKCADLIADKLKEREGDIRFIMDDPNSDEHSDPALSIDTKKITTVCLSWGGPADYLEITHNGLEIDHIIYRYSDWFDTATLAVDEDSPLYDYARYILEGDSANYE